MRKNFLILMLLSLLPLAGQAAAELSLTLAGTGITTDGNGYKAYYKAAAYAPALTVTWDADNGQGASPVTTYTTQWQKKNDNDEYVNVKASEVKNAGVYKVTVTYTPSGFDEQTASKVLTINKIVVSITADDASKTYGESDPGSFTAVVNYTQGENVGETLEYTVTRNNATVNDAGEYADVLVVTPTANSTVNANYTINPVAGKFTISKKAITITANPQTMIYGQEIPALTYTAPGLVGNDANADLTVANSITGMTAGLQIAVSDQQTDAVSQKLKVKEGGYTIAVTEPTTANNCNYTFAVVNSTLTVNKATLRVKVKNEEITFGDNLPATYGFEYVSGLTTAEEINEYVANGVIANSQQNSIFNNNSNPQFAYNPANPVNEGTYTVTGSGLASDNYKILYTTGTLKINQANIADANITVNTHYTQDNQQVAYTYLGGTAIQPALTTQVDAANYDVAYYNNTKAYTLTGQEAFTHQVNNETVAYTEDELAELGFPYVVITGKNNYTGTKKIAFGIQKANLTITAKADPITVGQTPVYSADIEGLLENNADAIKTSLLAKQAVADFTGTLTYACLGGNDAGSFTITPSGLTATNYNIDWENGTLTVGKGTLPLKVKTTAGTYGTAVTAALNFDYEFDTTDEAYAGLPEDVKTGLKTVVDPSVVTWTVKKNGEVVNPVNDAWNLAVGNGYTVEATATDPNYTITFDPASLTVNRKALTITIVPQTAALFDNEGNKKSIYTDGSVKLDAVFYDSQTNTAEYDPTNAENGYTVKVEGLQGNDQIDDLNITGLTSSVETVGVHTGAITLVVSSENGNYDYTNAGGTLTITGPSLDLIYAANEDNDAKIKNYDGATGVTVNLTRDIPTGYAEKWFAMVLPFNATLTELCTEFGCYVVVNTLDKANADASKVKFALQMQGITANEPFLIKFNSAVTGTAQTPKQFANRTISYKATPEAHDNAGNYFYGTFKQKTLNEEEDVEVGSKIWTVSPAKDKFVRLGAKTTTLNPLIGWLETATALDAFAPAIFVQDIDGTVTAINAVATDAPAVSAEGWYNLNGVKMQGVPTEKGVYIQNGKKVVVK